MTSSITTTLPMVTTFLNLIVLVLVIAATYPIRKRINEIQEAQEYQHDTIHRMMGKIAILERKNE